MKLRKNIFKSFAKTESNFIKQTLFDKKGKFIMKEDNCYIIDLLLCILSAKGNQKVSLMHLELFRCGVYISYPELKKVLKYVVKCGYIDNIKE
jgi:hypothetical protein